MKDIKAVVFDVDGTLLDEKAKLPKENVELLKWLKENGLTVFLATGRHPLEMPELSELNDYIEKAFLLNGSVVYNTSTGDWNKSVEVDSEKMVDMLLASENFKNNRTLRFMTNFEAKTFNVDQINEIKAYAKENSVKTMHINGDYEFIKGLTDEMKAYEVEENFFNGKDISGRTLDIYPYRARKIHAIENIIEEYGFKYSELLVCGDGMNDFDMLSAVEHSLTFENAYTEVKAISKYIAKSNNGSDLSNKVREILG